MTLITAFARDDMIIIAVVRKTNLVEARWQLRKHDLSNCESLAVCLEFRHWMGIAFVHTKRVTPNQEPHVLRFFTYITRAR
jgi:hypothetical protein